MEKISRRRHSSQTKADVLKSVFKDKKTVTEVCKQNDIVVSQFYSWQNDAFERLHRVFEDQKGDDALKGANDEIAELKRGLEQKTKFIIEIVEEHVKLKKRLGVN